MKMAQGQSPFEAYRSPSDLGSGRLEQDQQTGECSHAMSKSTPPTTKFTGFPKKAMQFWQELTSNMSKEWFVANKERYEIEWVMPITALLSHAAHKLASVYQPLALGEPKIMRIYRDVRFSKDKAPYKTHIDAVITVTNKSASKDGIAALYMNLGLPTTFGAVGCYEFDAAQLAKWRKAVDGKHGEDVQQLILKLRKSGYIVGSHDDYKKVPKGFDPDHSRAELLKMKGLIGDFPKIPPGLLHEPGFADWIVRHATPGPASTRGAV